MTRAGLQSATSSEALRLLLSMTDLLTSAIKQTRYLVLRQATAAQGMAQPSTGRVYTHRRSGSLGEDGRGDTAGAATKENEAQGGLGGQRVNIARLVSRNVPLRIVSRPSGCCSSFVRVRGTLSHPSSYITDLASVLSLSRVSQLRHTAASLFQPQQPVCYRLTPTPCISLLCPAC